MFGTADQGIFAEGVALVDQGLALIASQDLNPVPAAELGDDIKILSGLTDRLALQRTHRLALFEREGGHAASGDGSASNWLRRSCHLPGFKADRQMKLARQLEDLGDTQKAVESGQIGMEHPWRSPGPPRTSAWAPSASCSR